MIFCVSEDGINYLQNENKRTYAAVSLAALLDSGRFTEDEGIEIVRFATKKDPITANEIFHQLFEQGFIEDDEGCRKSRNSPIFTPRKPGPKPKGSDSWRYE